MWCREPNHLTSITDVNTHISINGPDVYPAFFYRTFLLDITSPKALHMNQALEMHKKRTETRKQKTTLKFPRHFLWGTAAAAHQVEGDNRNSWSEWEKQRHHIADKKRSGRACDHYNRFNRDFSDLKRLNNNTHRLSVEWCHLNLQKNQVNPLALDWKHLIWKVYTNS